MSTKTSKRSSAPFYLKKCCANEGKPARSFSDYEVDTEETKVPHGVDLIKIFKLSVPAP